MFDFLLLNLTTKPHDFFFFHLSVLSLFHTSLLKSPFRCTKRSPCSSGEEVVKKSQGCEGEMGLQELSEAEPSQRKRQHRLKSRGGEGLQG